MVRGGIGLSLVGLLALTANFAASTLPMRPLPQRRDQSCPDACIETGTNPANWTVVARFEQLAACARPVLMDFSLDIAPTEPQFIRTCDTWGEYYYHTPPLAWTKASDEDTERVVPQLAWTGAESKKERSGRRAVAAVDEIRSHLQRAGLAWNRTILFSAFGGATVGVYIGENMLNPSVANAMLPPLVDKIRTVGINAGKSALIQVCGQNRTSDLTFGVIMTASSDVSAVQAAVKSWSNGTCVDISSYGESSQLDSIPIRAKPLPTLLPSNQTTNITARSSLRGHALTHLAARANCYPTPQVEQGDSCGNMASRCGITPAEFTKYNPDPKMCSTLKPGQHVCCSAGTLPDFRPKQNSDGSCFVYETKGGDSCYNIAAANGLEPTDLEDMNKQTWGWAGCSALWVGVRMCLSKGTPPMPAPISNAVCGPQKPNTPTPPKGTNISEMNPCPLNVCCNIWGQCGTTEDFCVDTRGDGPPGTAKTGTYGCISNCGNDIVKGSVPANFIKLGYFEAFNLNRECLNMDVSQIDPSFTHVHFAFGMLKDDFTVFLEDEYARYQFEQFKKMRGPKRILSFGGWTFSAERPYYTIFRNGVKAANRDKLASNIAKFVNDAGIDGVDIDWEYPGAPDIPGIPPPDDPNEGTSYAAFLRVLRSKLNPDKSLSIAAPASFWYLKQFPIAGIAKIVDYIVYMTYDLHGQWDATNKWANPGCPSGSCLRSQINLTETLSALSMITKAGVPSNKIIVGVTSYGRSFQMVDPSCTGPDCLFTGGPEAGGSGAAKGRCTDTSGYISNAEIKELVAGSSGSKRAAGVKQWYDKTSDSNIMTYNGDNWVAYMNEAVRTSRTNLYKGYNMGGTTNWAVDLDKFYDPPPVIKGSTTSLSWNLVKQNIKQKGDAAACNRELRTGNWVTHECTEGQVTKPLGFLAKERWDGLGCSAAWNDAKLRWYMCDQPAGNGSFGESVAQFLHATERPRCQDLARVNSCVPDQQCSAHHSGSDAKEDWTGAGGYLVWNSLAEVHAMIENFHEALEKAAISVQNKKNEFISTFAPDGHRPDYALGLNILLILLQIPSTTLGTAFWKGAMKDKDFFKDNSLKLDMYKDTSQAMVMAGYNIGRNFIDKETIKEVSFNYIFDHLIGTWTEQLDTLIVKLFDGSVEQIQRLDDIMGSGQMVPGSRNGEQPPVGGSTSNHTAAFLNEQAGERAFYAAAIPSVWKMKKPYAMFPVILDFGPDCNRDIGSGDFFHGGEDFNQGWICLDNHNYILAGTYDRDNDGPNCSPEYWMWCNNPNFNWKPLFTLPGLKEIRKSNVKYAGVTVEDLVAGSVNSWLRAGKLNYVDDKTPLINPFNRDDFNDLWEHDIRAPGNIRIPVCNPKEATNLATDGLGHGIPEGDKASFPCLRDPTKTYESEWITWPR